MPALPVGTRRGLLLLLSIVVTLAAAEIVLRAAGYGRITPEMNFGINTRGALERGGFESDADLFWTLPAKANPVDQTINAVHPRRPVPPKGDRRRLVVLGDSCSRISMARPPYSELLQQRLGPGWEVLNAAVPGYTTFQGLTWLRTQLLDLEPDLVVVYFGWNDHWRSTGVTDREYARWRAVSRIRLLSLLRQRPAQPPLRVPLDEYEGNLRQMVDGIRDAGAQAILVAAPYGFSDEARQRLVQTGYTLIGEQPDVLHERYLEVVRGFAGEQGVAVLAADKLVAEAGAAGPLLMRDGIHLTDDAHAMLAAALDVLITTGAGADGSLPPELANAAQAALPESVAEPVQ